jgi:flagellar biosynthesis/type III secretory pathway protein FliH
VHPSLAASVTACLRKGLAPAVVEVVADPSREPGTVVFETARGNLDASVESQFQEIERGLTDRLRRTS